MSIQNVSTYYTALTEQFGLKLLKVLEMLAHEAFETADELQ